MTDVLKQEAEAVDYLDDSHPVKIISNAVTSDDPEARKAAADAINAKAAADKQVVNTNTETQWAPLIFSVLARDYQGASNAWNGGQTKNVEAFDSQGNIYFKKYNSRGWTGEILDATTKQPLTEQQVQKAGIVISSQDKTGAELSPFSGRQGLLKSNNQAIIDNYRAAEQAAISSGGRATLRSERADLAKGFKSVDGKPSVLDLYMSLPAEERARLARIKSLQTTAAQGATTEASKAISGSTSQTKGATSGLSGEIGVAPTRGAGGKPGIAPTGSAGATSGASTTNQGTVSASGNTGAGTTASTAANQQIDFRSELESRLQSKLSDQDYSRMQRYIQLGAMIDEADAGVDTSKFVPGVVRVPPQDNLLSGRQNSLLADYQGMKNEALTSAYAHFYAMKVHGKNGKLPDQSSLVEEFNNTDVVKGINHYYDVSMDKIRGKESSFKEGEVLINPKTNRVGYWRDGKWSEK